MRNGLLVLALIIAAVIGLGLLMNAKIECDGTLVRGVIGYECIQDGER